MMLLNKILAIMESSGGKRAYTVGSESFTYNELYRYTANIYAYLTKNNPERKPIIIYGHKQIYMKAAMLACAFEGAAYVPVDESTPRARVEKIIEQINPFAVIGDFYGSFERHISQKEITEIMQADCSIKISVLPRRENDVCYIIFTSGSSGEPKGVMVSYANLCSCVTWLSQIAPPRGVVLNQANFSFDLSVADFYLSLVGGCEHFITTATAFEFRTLFEQLGKSNATMAVLTPSFADMLLADRSFGSALMPKLDTIVFCGETLHTATVKKLFERFKSIRVINCYGPTECTFAVTSFDVDISSIDADKISVGKPKSGVKILIVDEKMNTLPEGETGEILIVGDSVSLGYINQGECSQVFTEFKNKRAYLTGDYGLMRGGMLYCYGRKDGQVKYKGYRVELTDIENNISSLAGVEKAAVAAQRNAAGEVQAIIAFVKPEGVGVSALQIREKIKSLLPEYMCPMVRLVENIPLNVNGKCDTQKLLEEMRKKV